MKTFLRFGNLFKKFRFPLGILLFTLMLQLGTTRAQTIENVEVYQTQIYKGAGIGVRFRVVNGVGASNYFTTGTSYSFWLSDPTGTSFPTLLYSFSGASGPMSADGAILDFTNYFAVNTPPDVTASATYKVRVTSTTPTAGGTTSGTLGIIDYLTINKQLISATPTKPGDPVTYSISYSNLNASSAATNVNLTDLLPNVSLLSYTNSSSSPNIGSATYNVSGATQNLTWPVIASLAAGSSGTLTVNGIIGRPGGTYGYDNTAYYISSGSSTQTISNSASISSYQTPAVTSNAVSFNVSQYCGINMPPSISGNIHTATSSDFFYLIDLQNTGNIKDRFALSSNSPGTGDIGMSSTFESLSGAVITQTPWLEPGQTYSFLIHFITPGGTPPNKWNYTTVTATSQVCNITANTVCSTYVYNGAQPSGADMIINKTASVNNLIAGLGFSYTLTVQNLASKVAKNISIIDTLPANVTYLGYTGASSGFSTPTYNATTREFRVNFPTNSYRNTDNPLSITINVMTACGSVPSVINKAHVTNTEGDQNISNNEKSVVVTVDPNEATPQNFAVGICEGQSVTLTPPGTLPANRGHKWYDAAVGGNLLANSTNYTTAVLTNSRTYWVTQYNQIDPTCESNRAMVTVNVTKDITINTSTTDQATCTNASFNVAATNGGVLNYKWQFRINTSSAWQDVPTAAPYSGANTATLDITGVTPALDGYQYRAELRSGTCFTKYSNPATLTIKKSNTWLGVTTNWLDGQNWCPAIPTSTTNVIIPAGIPGNIYPIITQASGAVAGNIDIQNGANIQINTGGKLEFHGNLVNLGTVTNNGILSVRGGGNSTFPGSGTVNAMSILEINKSGAGNIATLNKELTIGTELKPTQGTLAIGNYNITLQSNSTGTAYVSAVQPNADFSYGNGRFIVERYISQTRKWQLLSVPAKADLTGKTTIRQNWQENGAPPAAGYGVNITGPGASVATNGLDAVSFDYSLKVHNPATDTYSPVTSTLNNIQEPKGYYVYVYGDRATTANGAPGAATRLRTTGKLFVGRNGHSDYPTAFTPSSAVWHSVGNPFASPIDFQLWKGVSNTDIKNVLTMWDPSATATDDYGSGAYQTITYVGSNVIVTPGSGMYTSGPASNAYIQSGQAFFVERQSANPINLPFLEAQKVNDNRLVNRESGIEEVKMFSAFVMSNGLVKDGNRVIISPEYSNNNDVNDASKLTNPVVSFGMDRGPYWLSVESRNSITAGDTIHYSMGGMWDNQYRLAFAPQNMANPLLKAELVDRYTNTRTPLSLTDSSFVDVSMNGDDASRAYNRFYVVFSNNNIVVLPVNFVDVKAMRNADRTISVQWKVASEFNIARYEVQRSADAMNFTGILNADATNSSDYTKNDLSPLAFDNFYRIKAIGVAGDITYSKTVKVAPVKQPSSIVINPNPVKNGVMNIRFTDMATGVYNVEVINQAGQLMHTTAVSLAASTFSKTINLPNISTGVYHVVIRNSTGEAVFNDSILFE